MTTPNNHAGDLSGTIPGTVHLVDLDHTMQTQHASGGNQDVVLDPTPSADPNDPLNWTPRRKTMSAICVNLQVQFSSPNLVGGLSLTIVTGTRGSQECRVQLSTLFLFHSQKVMGSQYPHWWKAAGTCFFYWAGDYSFGIPSR